MRWIVRVLLWPSIQPHSCYDREVITITSTCRTIFVYIEPSSLDCRNTLFNCTLLLLNYALPIQLNYTSAAENYCKCSPLHYVLSSFAISNSNIIYDIVLQQYNLPALDASVVALYFILLYTHMLGVLF